MSSINNYCRIDLIIMILRLIQNRTMEIVSDYNTVDPENPEVNRFLHHLFCSFNPVLKQIEKFEMAYNLDLKESLFSRTEREDQCCICLQQAKNPVVYNCNHYFCYDCINHWANTSETCPLCRQELRPVDEWWITHLIKVKERLERATLALRVMNLPQSGQDAVRELLGPEPEVSVR